MKWAVALLCFAAVAAHAQAGLGQARVGEVTTDRTTTDLTTNGASGESRLKSASVSGGALVMSGSAVSASGRAATLKLDRGGAVHICPRTTVTASTSPSGRELMLAVDSGTLELDYELGPSADSIITPDLRLSIAGPSSVHLSVDVLKSGDVCVASKDHNNAAVLASELAGEGSYQIRPGQQITFIKGSTSQARTEAGINCGCPAPASVLRAATPPPTPQPAQAAEMTATTAPASNQLLAQLPPAAASSALPQQPGNDSAVPTHTVVEMDAPMVYNGQRPQPPSDTLAEVKLFRAADSVLAFPPLVLPAQQPSIEVRPSDATATATGQTSKPSHGIFHRFGTFLASLFR